MFGGWFKLKCVIIVIVNVLLSEKDISDHLKDFTDLFSLTNLKSTAIYIKGPSCTSLNATLTNKPKRFHDTSVFTTGLSDCHKLLLSYLRAYFKCLPPERIFYRDYKSFNQEDFLRELDSKLVKGTFYQIDEPFSVFLTVVKGLVDTHAPLKQSNNESIVKN